MGTSSPFLCLDPLPCPPSMLHSHDLIIPAARYRDTRGNRWLLGNTLLSGLGPVLVLGSGMLTVSRRSVRPPCVWVHAYSNNRDEMRWIEDGHPLLFSPNSPQWSLLCVTDEQNLEDPDDPKCVIWRNLSAIWIPSSCSLPTCSIVWLCCYTWMEAHYSQKGDNKRRHFLLSMNSRNLT